MIQCDKTITPSSAPVPINNSKVASQRPGRMFRKTRHDDINVSRNYGHDINIKNGKSVRIFFQNVKGLTYSASGEDYEYYLHNLKLLQVDIAGLAETNTPWQLHHIKTEFLQSAKKHYPISKTTFGSIDATIDPVLSTERFQSGGCLLMVQGKWTTTIQKDEITDPTGLGRWTGSTITGSRGKAISIISAYRSCNGSIQSSGIGTTFHREYAFLRNNGIKSPQPRQRFFQDLEATIKVLQLQGHAVILMLDANEVLRPTGKFAEFLERLDLHDVHHNDPAPSTFIGSTNRRIDYIFGCHQLRGYMTSSGTLSYVDGPQSDHRGMFVDVNFADFVSYDANANPHLAAQARTLRTGNPELVTSYIHEMLQYYTSHRMEERITNLHKNFKQMEKEDIKKELEAWDRDPGRAMKKAEKEISKPKQQYAWLPKLRNAAIIRRYWKLRFRDVSMAKTMQQLLPVSRSK